MGQIEKELYQSIIDERTAYEMAQVGVAVGLELWVWPKEGGYVPHFHFWTVDRKIGGCLKLESAEYFKHGKHQSELGSHQRRQLCEFLQKPAKNFPGLTNWQVVLGMWNSSNPQAQVDLNQQMPNYKELNK